MLRFPTFTTAIYDQYRSSFNGAGANMLASVLVLCCLLLLLAELRLRGHRRYRPGRAAERRGSSRASDSAGSRSRCWPAAAAPAGRAGSGRAVLQPRALADRRRSTAFPVGEIASRGGHVSRPGAGGGVADGRAAVPVAWLAVRFRRQRRTSIERSTYFANALPGIVVALALVTVSIRVRAAALPDVRRCCSRPTRSCSCHGPWSRARRDSPRRRRCSRTSRTGWASALSSTARRVTLPLIAPGRRSGRGTGVPRRGDRADRDAAARADRHHDAGDAVLVELLLGRLRRGGAVRAS